MSKSCDNYNHHHHRDHDDDDDDDDDDNSVDGGEYSGVCCKAAEKLKWEQHCLKILSQLQSSSTS